MQIITRAIKRRLMRREINEELKSLGFSKRQAKKMLREELKLKPTLKNMHKEIVGDSKKRRK